MSDPLVRARVDSDLKKLGETIQKTAQYSRKGLALLLADATTQITIGGNGIDGLYQGFRKLRPNPDTDIRSAPWGIGRTRRVYGEVSRHSVSIAAQRRAEAIMGNNPSLLFRMTGSGPLKKPVPLTIGVRKNVLFRPGKNALPKYAKVKGPGEKRLNLRALAVYYELQLRATGTGISAAEFAIRRSTLGQNLRRAADSNASVRLVQLRSAGLPIGSVEFDGASARVRGYLSLRSDVTGIEQRTVAAVLADKQARLEQAIAKFSP